MRLLTLLAMACLLSACHRLPLNCRSEYLYLEHLASFQVDTPDPQQECFCGQQIVVSWDLPYTCRGPLELRLHMRYGTREIETVTAPIRKLKGFWIYRLLNQDYLCKQGIVSFNAEILQNGELLTHWTHSLWAELIEIAN